MDVLWELISYIAAFVGAVLLIYVIVRIASHAYFKSREDFERTRNAKEP